MDWIDKIPKWIQIPLKILLPSLCIFSGILLFINDELAEKLYLKQFREENGFVFGLIFTITLSLILVYIIFFASKPVIKKFKQKLKQRQLRKSLENLKKNEKLYIWGLHNISTHAYMFPYSDPTINLLSQKMYVYTYSQELDLSTYDGNWGVIYILNPIVEEAVTKIMDMKAKEIGKLNRKIEKTNNEEKRKDMQSTLEYKEKKFRELNTLSLEKYFQGEE